MSINMNLLSEIAKKHGLPTEALVTQIETINCNYESAHKDGTRTTLDFGQIIRSVCGQLFTDGLFTSVAYKKALGEYYSRNKKKKKKPSDLWSVTQMQDNKVRVQVTPSTEIEFRVIVTTRYRNRKPEKTHCVDSPVFVYSGRRDITGLDTYYVDKAQALADAWLRTKKKQAA